MAAIDYNTPSNLLHPLFLILDMPSKKDLAEDCARWIVASLAHIWLAIGINIKYSFTKDQNDTTIVGSHSLIMIFCYTWQIEEITVPDKLPTGEQVDVLKRADSATRGASSWYYFFIWHGGQLFRLQAYNHIKAQVYPKKSQETIDAILIQRQHVYYSDPTSPDKHSNVIFKLTFDQIQEAIKEMHKMQVLADLVFDWKRKSEDSPAEEQIKMNILKLKNGLAKNKDEVVV